MATAKSTADIRTEADRVEFIASFMDAGSGRLFWWASTASPEAVRSATAMLEALRLRALLRRPNGT